MATVFKRKIRRVGPVYFHEIEGMDPVGTYGTHMSIYDTAVKCEDVRNFELDGFDTEGKLEHLVKEINTRIRITKQEIFKIGKLLNMAKKICQEENISIKDWIKSNF